MNFVIGLIGLVAVVLGIGLTVMRVGLIRDGHTDGDLVSIVKRGGLILIAGVLLFIFSNSFKIIPTGYTGVRTTFGQISEETVPNGFNWKAPFVQNIRTVNNKQQDAYFEDKVWSETAARTAICYQGIIVTYQINPEKSAWIYANVSNYEDALVSSGIVASSVKSASKGLADTDATNRANIEPLAMAIIQNALDEKYGKNVVYINKVVINSADFEDGYNKAIAKKQQAQLEAERQEITNKKNVAKAEADAKVKEEEAKANAVAKLTEAEAEAKANAMLEKSLSDKVLRNAEIEKWDGKMPSVVSSDDTGLMVSVK